MDKQEQGQTCGVVWCGIASVSESALSWLGEIGGRVSRGVEGTWKLAASHFEADRCEPSIAEIPFATPPFAKTDRGQLARLAEMDARPEFQALGGFSLAAFGGRGRVCLVWVHWTLSFILHC